MNLIFDSHAHYDDMAFNEDRDAVLESLAENGVGKVMEIAAEAGNIERMLGMVAKYDFMYAACGVHPTEVYELADSDIHIVENNLSNEKVKAIGEIGLDYHYDDTDKAKQAFWFERQIELAKKHSMPIVVHSRDAAADTLDMIKACNAGANGGVIHCFSYEKEMTKIYMDMGFYIGVGGVVTFPKSRKLKEIVEMMPMDLMLIETDCPYLAPDPRRGRRNDSRLLKYVVSEIAQIKGIDEDEVRRITAGNACRLYRI